MSLRCAGYNPAVGAPRAVPWAVVADAPPAAGYLESRVPGRPPPPPRPLLPDGTGVPAVAAATRGGGGLSRFSGRVAGVATWGPTAARDGGRRPPLCTPREARRAPICSFVSPGGLVVRICTVKYMIACHSPAKGVAEWRRMAAAATAVAAAAATVSVAGGRGDPTLYSFSAAAVVASPPRWRLPVGCVARVAAAPTGARGPLFTSSLRDAPPPPPSQRHLLIPTERQQSARLCRLSGRSGCGCVGQR